MKKFVFRLEKVLKHKLRLFEIAQAKHLEAINLLKEEENKLDDFRNNYKECLNDLASKTSGNFQVRDLGPFYRYLSSTKKEIASQSKVVCEAMEREDKLKKELLSIAKEKEILIKLKEKEYEKYLYQSSKEEQYFLDELNSLKYSRAMGGI